MTRAEWHDDDPLDCKPGRPCSLCRARFDEAGDIFGPEDPGFEVYNEMAAEGLRPRPPRVVTP